MKIDLLPCPFCGGKAKLVQIKGDNHDYWADGLFFIEVNHNWNGENHDQPCIMYSCQFGHYGGGYNRKTGEYSPITEKAKKACEEWNRREGELVAAVKAFNRITSELHMMMKRRNPEDVVSIEDIVRERVICEAIRQIDSISLDTIV